MEMVHFIPPSQRKLAVLAAQEDSVPVLISGASGTGKSAMARWIHANGPRAIQPFVVAGREKPLAQQMPLAQGGTLMIPEIGEWPLGEQLALLNFLNTHSVMNEENTMPKLLNIRMIVTSNQDLGGRASGGLFNSELYEKLSKHKIEMPALTERGQEFEDIVYGVLNEIVRELQRNYIKGLTEGAWAKLRAHDWPGNLRELRNVLRMATVATQGNQISEADLPDFGSEHIDFKASREEFERIYLLELLKTFDWQIDQTCQASRMDKAAFLAKVRKYGILVNESSVSP